MSVHSFLAVLTLYLEIGLAVALGFVVLVGYLDRAARGAYAFRLMIMPGAVLLWPLLLTRLVRFALQGGRR